MAKVQRYWPGKRVIGAEREDGDTVPASTAMFSSRPEDTDVKRTPIVAAVIVKKEDPRLSRLAKTDLEEARGEGRQRHR
jgi:hypothetical protein